MVLSRRNNVGDVMKKGTSFYLEEDIFEEIEKYRVDNGLKSKNTALERLIIEYKSLKKELEYARVLVDYAKNIMSEGHIIVNNQENKNNIGNTDSSTGKKKNSRIAQIAGQAYNNMSDN